MAEQGPTSHNTDLALKTVAFSTITLLAVLAIYKLRVLIVSLVIAITLASAITPIAEAAEKKRIPRLITVLVLLAAASMIYGLLAASLVPSIHEQWLKFNDNL